MSDMLLQKFFEIKRWEDALEVGVGKHIDKGELRKLTSPEEGEGWRMFAFMKKVIADNNFDFTKAMSKVYNK